MLFVHSGNEYSAILRNGDVIKFEDEREAKAVRAMYEDVQAVLGRVQSDECRAQSAECEIQNTECRAPKKKKLRISIDTDTEFFCIRKALA